MRGEHRPLGQVCRWESATSASRRRAAAALAIFPQRGVGRVKTWRAPRLCRAGKAARQSSLSLRADRVEWIPRGEGETPTAAAVKTSASESSLGSEPERQGSCPRRHGFRWRRRIDSGQAQRRGEEQLRELEDASKQQRDDAHRLHSLSKNGRHHVRCRRDLRVWPDRRDRVSGPREWRERMQLQVAQRCASQK